MDNTQIQLLKEDVPFGYILTSQYFDENEDLFRQDVEVVVEKGFEVFGETGEQ